MNFKNILFYFSLISVLLIAGCTDDPLVTKAEENLFDIGGAAVTVAGVSTDIFDLSSAELIPVTFEVKSVGETTSSTDMSVSYNGGSPNFVKTITTFPSTESLNLAEAAAACGVAMADLAIEDVFTITFDNVNTSSGVYNSGAKVVVGVIESAIPFKSALKGVFDCKTTLTNQMAGYGWDACEGQTWEGTVEWVALHTDPEGDGSYDVFTIADSGDAFNDVSHGAYYPCYGTDAQGSLPNDGNGMGDLTISDVDGFISMPGASQWGEVYSINSLSVAGNVLTFNWSNDYGEGATVELTRTDGEVWPENLSN